MNLPRLGDVWRIKSNSMWGEAYCNKVVINMITSLNLNADIQFVHYIGEDGKPSWFTLDWFCENYELAL